MPTRADTHLLWLPAAPADFRNRVRTARSGADGAVIRALAGFDLSENQLPLLAKLIDTANVDGHALNGLAPFKLGLVSNSTTDFVVPAIVATGARFGLNIACVTADYGQYMQAALNPTSALNTADCDAVLVALDAGAFALESAPGDATAANAALDGALELTKAIGDGLRAGGATVIVQTLARPVETLLGSFDALLAGSLRSQVDAFNRSLIDAVRGTTDRLLDVAALAETVGLANWHDPRLWNLAKQSVANAFVPLYADHLCRLLAAIHGKSRKVLVLDLDNTVWGGIIGDDGMDGIRIAQGDPVGEAHLSLQTYALKLRERGILLAVSSKNTDEVARRVFAEHPDMLLREEHISLFQANWDDKVSNLRAIAEALSLGLDSLVFVDDNPAERGLVRQLLPEVAVPELPDDPALYARTVAAAGYFEATAFSEEDRQRAGQYAANARRVQAQVGVGAIDDYLRSLEMRIAFAPFDRDGRARIVQLINKSNQFNLTTRRYTEEEIAALIDDRDAFTLQVRLSDAFGDNGMISTVICRPDGRDWAVDTWLMSCRVIGRGVEGAVLEEIVTQARMHGVEQLRGVYRPTPRNGMVLDHYRKLGFQLSEEQPDGTTVWTLNVADAAGGGPDLFAERTRRGFDATPSAPAELERHDADD